MTYVRKTGWVLGFLFVAMSNAQDAQSGEQPAEQDHVQISQAAPADAAPQQDQTQNAAAQVPVKSPASTQPIPSAPSANDANVSRALDPHAGNATPVDTAAMKAESTAPITSNAASTNTPHAQDPKAGNTAPIPPTQPVAPASAPHETAPAAQPAVPEVPPTPARSEPSASPAPASQPAQTHDATSDQMSTTFHSEMQQSPAQPTAAQPEPVQPTAAQPEPVQPTPAPRQPRPRPMPTRAAPTQAQAPKPGPDEIIGLDTVDLENPQGNWLFKRVWWERAEAKYEKIHETVTKTTEARTAFFAKRVEIEKNVLDPFYLNIGFSQGELQAVLSDLNSSLEVAEITKASQEKEDEEQVVMDSAQEEAQALKQLQQDVDQVIKHDETLDAAVMQLADQITRMRNYEQQAWQDFKDIARVLDDKKARELFYKVDNAWRNVQEIQAYIEQGFSTSFDKISEQIKSSVTRITSTIATLKEKGFDLKKRAQQLAGNIQEEKPQEQPGFFARMIINPIKRVFTAIASGIQMVWDYTVFAVKWPFQKIMGSAPAAQEPTNEAEQAPEAGEQPASEQEETAALEPCEETLQNLQDFVAQSEVNSDELPDTMEELDLREIALNDRKSFDSFDSEPSCDTPDTVMA